MSRNYTKNLSINANITRIAFFFLFFQIMVITAFSCKITVHADQKIYYQKRVIATKDSRGVITFRPSGGDDHSELEYILRGDQRKTVVLPKGKTIKIGSRVSIGSNTMLNATGATIIQTNPSYGLLMNDVDAINYSSVHNVTIVGGTWKNKYNTKAVSSVRFAHGRDLKFKNMTIISNYQSHCLELIACKDVKVYNCTLRETNDSTKSKTSVEDALQIDLATPRTAPGVYRETGKKMFVNGQTCQNIRVEKCTIYGSRGICANYARYESQFHNKYHRNITIYNNKITGVSAQGIALYNTIDALVQGNVVKNTSTQSGVAYPSGIHLNLFGKTSGGKNVIAYNTVYGMKRGIYVDTEYSGTHYSLTKLIGNKVYVKSGLAIDLNRAGSVSKSGNRTGRW